MREKIIEALNRLPVKYNSVIIYDIDGTLIKENGAPNNAIIDTYIHALSRGFRIVIITARLGTEENIRITRHQLHSLGIIGYDTIYFLPVGKTDQVRYKIKCRMHLLGQGIEIAVTVGDMHWDISPFGGIGFLV